MMVLEFIVASIAIASNPGPEEALKTRFFEECPPALARFEERFSKAKGVAWLGRPGGTSQRGLGNPIHFATDGPLKLFQFGRSGKVKNDTQSARFVYCLAGPKSFSLQSTGDGPFRITNIGGDAMAVWAFRTVFGKYLDSAYVIFGNRMVDMIKSPEFKFKLYAIRELPGPPNALVQVEFEAGAFEGKPIPYKVTLDPSNEWAIVESEIRLGPTLEVVAIDYGPNRANLPTYPASISLKEMNGQAARCEFEGVEFGPVDQEQFKIESYGLKDPTGSQPDRSSRLSWWLGAAGAFAALLLGSVILKKMADRRR